jgi:hypothetical protein
MQTRILFFGVFSALALTACQTATPDHCAVGLKAPLSSAISKTEHKLSEGCEAYFDSYFDQLLTIAQDHPDADNKRLFSEHLVRVSESGYIGRRQAQGLYNRYFNVKFVTLTGDYNTCAQTCPVRHQVLSDMQAELLDKEIGLMKVSGDRQSFYRADHLLKESQLVLEATCRACDPGMRQ